MEQILKVWIEKEGYSIDKNISFDIKPHIKASVEKVNKPYETIKLTLERVISLKEYQGGFIGKYRKDLTDLAIHFLQEYAIENGLEFVVDPKKEHTAVTEAKKMGLPIIAIMNTDCNLKQVEYPIIANDASISSISFFLSKIKEAYNNGASGVKE